MDDRWFVFTSRLRFGHKDVEEIKAVPSVPLSHPFVEWLIGTVRRELLDQILFWNVTDLQRKLDSFRDYYNRQRIHKSRDGRPPAETANHDAALDRFGWQRCCPMDSTNYQSQCDL